MNDEIMGVCHKALQSFIAEVDEAIDSFLFDLSPEEYHFYARLGVIADMAEFLNTKNMED